MNLIFAGNNIYAAKN